MNFEDALEIVLKHEGGWVDHPDDPGGETNLGIAVATARAHGYTGPMRTIPMDVVRRIYRQSFWDATRCDALPPAIRLAVFDAAVNSGPSRAARWLQAAVGATADGVIGPRTMAAIAAVQPPERIVKDLCARRLLFLAGLGHFAAFGRGWVRRVADILQR